VERVFGSITLASVYFGFQKTTWRRTSRDLYLHWTCFKLFNHTSVQTCVQNSACM